MENLLDFTVVIPTYNGGKRIPAVLERLQAQIDTENISWEVVVIDNNSSDETAKIVKDYQVKQFLPVELRYYFEAKQGLTFARQRGVQEARGKFVAFIDDDNYPEPNWIAAAVTFGNERDRVGAYGGQIYGQYESQPPDDFKKLEYVLGIRQYSSKPCLFEPERYRLPIGAGLVVRKQAWLESVPDNPILVGRVGNLKVAGEDFESVLYMYKSGWELWHNPEMKMYHYIPAFRLEKDYLLATARGNSLAICTLRMIIARFWQKPMIFIRTLLGNLGRIIRQYIRYRGRIQDDLIAEVNLAFYWGGFLSCFFWLVKVVQVK